MARDMRLRLLGVRGSRPVHKAGLLGYGGNSTSMEFLLPSEDFRLILDGGSGIAFARGEADGKDVRFLVTHTHWDHILGYPFFSALRDPDTTVTFYASTTSRATFYELFFGLQRSAHLPLPPSEFRANIKFREVKPNAAVSLNERVEVVAHQINHQGITLGYRVNYQAEGKAYSGAVITDNAPIEDNHMGEGMAEKAAADPKAFEEGFNRGLSNFLSGCHTVVFDTHFTEENLKADWGHSTPERALDLCINAGSVSRLVLFHHAPEDLDEDVVRKVESVLERGAKNGIEVVAAREGDVWTLSSE